jgi:hypothetical protein
MSEAPKAAIDNGHNLVWDPPAALTAARRWTCQDCGATAIRYNDNEYGSAVENICPGTQGDAALRREVETDIAQTEEEWQEWGKPVWDALTQGMNWNAEENP